MAKGNMLLGYSRGSVGDVTFYRAGGSQRQRARNRQPNNPRTARQMAQRSVFANAVKFFKQVNSGFFRFAYEDKKTNESDYNAFMRHNVANSGYIGAKASKISDWPALGLWQISAGSLKEITAPFPQPTQTNEGIYFDLGVSLTEPYNTVGELSAALINGAPQVWRVGDILTVLMYRATMANTLPTTDTETTHNAYVGYTQIILNTADTTPLVNASLQLGDIGFTMTSETDGFAVLANDASIVDLWPRDLFGFAVIHSRNTANGLQVSSSTMVYNKTNVILDAMSDSGEYYNEVLADWQASADAILQGGNVKSNANFRVLNVREDNAGVNFSLDPDGVWRAPVTVMSSADAYLLIRVETPNYVPLSGISINPIPTGLIWNISQPITESYFDGIEVINDLNRTGQWTAGRYTINFGGNNIVIELT